MNFVIWYREKLDIEDFPIQSVAEADVGEIFLFFLNKSINFIKLSSDIYVRELWEGPWSLRFTVTSYF